MAAAQHNNKACYICKEVKPCSSFYNCHKHDKQEICRTCHRQVHKGLNDADHKDKLKEKALAMLVHISKDREPKKTKRNYDTNKYKQKYEEKREQCFRLLGNKCVRCKEKDRDVLQIDHIYGGGTKERKKTNSLTRCVKVLNNPSQYQILCANCNIKKKKEEEEKRNGRR
jgi:hypothetical protein